MIKPELKEVLDQLGRSHFGKALVEYLEEERKGIDTVRGIVTIEEAIGRQRALEIIEKLFWFLKEKEPPKVKSHTYV